MGENVLTGATTETDSPLPTIALLHRDDASLRAIVQSAAGNDKRRIVEIDTADDLEKVAEGAPGIVLVLDGDADTDLSEAKIARSHGGPARPILFVVSPERLDRIVRLFASRPPVDFVTRPVEAQVVSFKLDQLLRLGADRAELEREVGKQSRARESLERNQMEFSTIFDHAPNMMLLVDEGMRVRRINQAMLEFLDCTAEEATDMVVGEAFHCIYTLDGLRPCREAPECAKCTLVRAIEQTFVSNTRLRGASISVQISSGSRQETVELLLSATPVEVDGERLQFISFEDITSRKQAEEALRQSSEFQQQILKTAATAVFTVDDNLRITSVNDEFSLITGFRPDDVVGEHCSVLRGEPCQTHCGVFDPTNEGSVRREQCTITASDGQRLTIIKNANLTYDEGGKITGGIESFVDVTEMVAARKRAEDARVEIEETNEQLQKAVERANQMAVAAELANQAKSEFLANMSHEIRTPMNGVLGMTDLLLDTEMDREQRDYAETVRQSAEALLTLINDILDFSKIEAGKLELDPIEFRLADNMNDTINTFALRAAERGIELACYIAPDVPDSLVGDPGRLRQIVVNLIGNAIKFTKKGEVVLRIALKERSDDTVTLQFSVTDTGIGVPAEKQKVIFEVFSQADGSTTREFGGTGLGLTISSQLVNMMRGDIWVESPVPGREEIEETPGSVFHFTARFGVQKETQTDQSEAIANLPEGLRVLVVDDNATSREIIASTLKNWGMPEPVAVESGTQALAALDATRQNPDAQFSLVVVDVLMPEMDGFAVAERITQDPDYKDVRIVMLISAGQRGDVARCRELGVSAYLAKPCRQSELRSAIVGAMARPGKSKGAEGPITRHSIRERRRALRLLLAEDNPVNQKLALRILEKRGYKVTVANNGRQAAETYANNQHNQFDAVLMDVQMPEMDGFEATAAIRELEKKSGKHTPIVAMTAHAMQGYRERCLDAGMDGYVTKPIIAQTLFETIESLAGAAASGDGQDQDREIPLSVPEKIPPTPPTAQKAPEAAAQAAPNAEPNEDTLPVFQHDVALGRAADDEDLLKELVEMFLEDVPEQLRELEETMAAGDLKTAERHAHSMKGASANLGAEAMRAAAYEMEKANRDGAPDDTRATQFDRLQAEFERLKSELEKI